jgi:hypothetical protein
MAVTRLASIAAAALVLVPQSAARVGPTFRDAIGDAGGAPDITAVHISYAAESVVFAISTADASSWDGAAAILSIDADANPMTGNAGGETGYELSYVLHSQHTEFTLDESNGVHVAHPAASWNLAARTLSITVPRAELGESSRIGFRVETLSSAGSDAAPERSVPEWSFSPTATVTGIAERFTPATPRTGRLFALKEVRIAFSDGTSGTTPASCTATLGHANVHGQCRWRVPARSHGRMLTVRIMAAGLKRTYRFRIR